MIKGKKRAKLGEVKVPDGDELVIKKHNKLCILAYGDKANREGTAQKDFALKPEQYNAIGARMGHDRMLLLLAKREKLKTQA